MHDQETAGRRENIAQTQKMNIWQNTRLFVSTGVKVLNLVYLQALGNILTGTYTLNIPIQAKIFRLTLFLNISWSICPLQFSPTPNENKIYMEWLQSIWGLEQKHRLPYQYVSKNAEEILAAHLHLDNLQGSWKYPELCRRCSCCCINQKGILLTRYINIRWCDTASGNNCFLFH